MFDTSETSFMCIPPFRRAAATTDAPIGSGTAAAVKGLAATGADPACATPAARRCVGAPTGSVAVSPVRSRHVPLHQNCGGNLEPGYPAERLQ